MVGHSYGGAIILKAASTAPATSKSDGNQGLVLQGLILIDALVPGVWPKSEVEKNQKVMRTQYQEVREKAPQLAKVAIPWAEAMPETAQKLDAIQVSSSLPIIDIVAENGQSSPETTQIWRKAHAEFTANNPNRESVLAAGSSHKVMADKPDLVVQAILKMLGKIKTD